MFNREFIITEYERTINYALMTVDRINIELKK